MKNFVFLLCSILLMSCGSDSKKVEAKPTLNSSSNTPIQAESFESYPALTGADMQELADRTTFIDYIFYELPISMSLDNKAAINSALRQISDQPAKIFKNCKPMGRVIYQDNGEIFKEADFYFNPPCFGLVFIEGSTKTKSSMMTEEGATFFGNLLKNAGQQTGGQ